jgi:WD40 repeat protein
MCIQVGGPGGQLAAIGGKRQVLLLDLDNPYQALLSLKFPGKFTGNWEKVCLSWNYAAGHRTRLASSNNRDVLLWDVDTMQTAATISNANRLPVSETAWAPSHPHLLATCCSDPTINMYDVRALGGGGGGSVANSKSKSSGAAGITSGTASTSGRGEKPVISLSAPGLLSANVIAFNRYGRGGLNFDLSGYRTYMEGGIHSLTF